MTNKHHGQILEFTLRKNDYNITELAKSLSVNRRTLYNWFNKKKIKKDIMFRIGCIIRHDFSIQLPELFPNNEFGLIYAAKKDRPAESAEAGWKSKYMKLLREYHQLAKYGKI